MPLSNPPSAMDKNEIKRGEEKLKSIIGGKFVHDAEFLRLLKANNIKNTSKAWGIINNQVKIELKSGILAFEDIEERVYQLVLMQSPHDRLITLEEVDAVNLENIKLDILSKGRISIQLPYKSSGVGDVVVGAAVLGKTGALIGALNEGQTNWKASTLLIGDEGVNVKTTGDVILYEDVKSVVVGEKSILHTIVTVITENGGGLIFKVDNNYVKAIKSIIEERIPAKTEDSGNHEHVNGSDDADVLLKYADLYERGLLSWEEFNMKKEELLYGSNKKAEPPKEKQQRFCSNCGRKIEIGSNFCTNCGQKIN